jgi:hypothetical protein
MIDKDNEILLKKLVDI